MSTYQIGRILVGNHVKVVRGDLVGDSGRVTGESWIHGRLEQATVRLSTGVIDTFPPHYLERIDDNSAVSAALSGSPEHEPSGAGTAADLSASFETAAHLETLAPSPLHAVVAATELHRLITQELEAGRSVFFNPHSSTSIECIVEPFDSDDDGWAQGFGPNALHALHVALTPKPVVAGPIDTTPF